MPIHDMEGPVPGGNRPRGRRATPLRGDDVRRILAACPNTPAGRRDRALVATMRAALLRGSEAARLTWADIDRQPDGTALLDLKGTKTDPANRTRRRVRIPSSVLHLIDHMQADRGIDPRLFRLAHTRGIHGRVQIAGERVGIEGLSAHSPRRGAAQDLLEAGASLIELQIAGRWTTINTVERYVAEMGGEQIGDANAVLDPDHRPPEPQREPRHRLSRTMQRILDLMG